MPRLLLSFVLVLLLTSCSRPQPATDVTLVVTSTSILADIVRQVAPPNMKVHPLIPPGVDPHGFEPGPRDLAAIAQAGLIITTGEDLSPQLLKQLTGTCPQAEILLLGERRHHGHSHDHSHDHDQDPHVWLNPNVVRSWLPAIASYFHKRGTPVDTGAYDRKLAEADAEVRRQLSSIPEIRRSLVIDHDCMTHFCGTYGFSTAAVLVKGSSTLAAPSARHIASVQTVIQEKSLPAVFITSEEHRPLAARIGADLQIPVYRLYVDALAPENGPATYLELLTTNAVILRKALGEASP